MQSTFVLVFPYLTLQGCCEKIKKKTILIKDLEQRLEFSAQKKKMSS